MLKKILERLLQAFLMQLELEAREWISLNLDAEVEKLLAKIAAAIPGGLDDAAIAALKPVLKEQIEIIALKLVDRISPRV